MPYFSDKQFSESSDLYEARREKIQTHAKRSNVKDAIRNYRKECRGGGLGTDAVRLNFGKGHAMVLCQPHSQLGRAPGSTKSTYEQRQTLTRSSKMSQN